MSSVAEDWQSDIDAIDARLIDEYQSEFPICERPFRAVAAELGIDETEALARVEHLREAGIFRRFGAVLNPPVIGSSALAAINAPEDRFSEIADVVNSYRQINHNYRRDHEWNMWFVITAGSREIRDGILDEIEEETGCTVLRLPMLTDFYINLEFPVVNTDRFAGESNEAERSEVQATRISESATGDLSALEARLLLAIQNGLPLTATPYCDVADELDASVETVLDAVRRLLETGCIKRIGCVVNHVATGFDANCMVVWDVPEDELDACGADAGALPYVTLCYHRPRRPEQGWPYNLFTMIHGRNGETVDEKIDELADDHLPYTHERLYSTETLKQTGARYDELVGGE